MRLRSYHDNIMPDSAGFHRGEFLSIRRSGSRPRRGFTLIELMVVISVIVLLVGLTLAAGVAVIHQSERRQTQGTLDLLDMAVNEWEQTADRQLTWGTNGKPVASTHYDVQETTAFVFIISEMLSTMNRVDSVKQIMARIDPQCIFYYKPGLYPPWLASPAEAQEMDARFIGSMTVLDAWGTPIYATHPGAMYDAQLDVAYPMFYPKPIELDPDGTTRTFNEHKYGVVNNRHVRFVSAGPDLQFGNLSADPDSTPHPNEFDRTKDNLYSYPVNIVAGAAADDRYEH